MQDDPPGSKHEGNEDEERRFRFVEAHIFPKPMPLAAYASKRLTSG
jgi:hypothetical protein